MKSFGVGISLRHLGILVLALLVSACASKSIGDRPEDAEIPADKMEIQKRAAIRMQLAIGYYQQGQFKVALSEVRQAIQISPDLVDAYAMRAVIYMTMGEKVLAEENFLHALKLAPNNSEVANNYGWFLCQNGNGALGLTYLEKAMKDPGYATPGKAYNNAGMCSLILKNLPSAEKYFLSGLKVDPSNLGVNVNLAKIYFDRLDFNQAQFYINRVIKLDLITAEVLWLAVKIERRLGSDAAANGLAVQLRRRFPESKEFNLLQRGAFDE